jgi:putative PIN family toxin of toxin-antitoxin system
VKIVVDTNVFVSSFLSPTGSPRQVIDLWKMGQVTLCLCAETLNEHLLVLARLGLQGEPEMDELLALIRRSINIRFVAIEGTLRAVADDPDDDPFVECAVTAGAQYIVSGDRHLKKLGRFGEIRIVSPADFLRLFEDRQVHG